MKSKLTLLAILSLPLFGFSQRLNVNAGTSFSKIDYQRLYGDYFVTDYEQYFMGVNLGFQLDYLEKEHFYLSSSLNYLQKGGTKEYVFPSQTEEKLESSRLNFNYLSLNTVINYKLSFLPFEKLNPVVFAGPRVDYLMGYNSSLDLDINANDLMFGINAGLALRYDFQKFSLGWNAHFLHSFNNLADINYEPPHNWHKIKDLSFSTQLSFGYNF
ncbi:Outer membrane protein beta-barrel domain-containing protein [Lishizhenia tianjinensis]|uniref:Outer membrane protein beta-barrel domain-containing protein n=1 Tax=Lishizhenia tianjinensis TaxID=477690 RepID=A0A1I6YRK6_9FLAO|nr:outer membrane beta-barrel protein [Lishizhenia tianjinensis]SFT53063.1 Outer membrane protein beta-barrel domain-containing protein [Lishizhenia tianjinensis]